MKKAIRPKDKVTNHNLSILLLKDEIATIEEATRLEGKVKEFIIGSKKNPLGVLYVKTGIPKPPRWTSFFVDTIADDKIGITSSLSAIFLINSNKRIFAISFGQGRYLLKPDSWEERFGLKVALNCIGQEKIRTINKQTFDAISRQSTEQASKETEARDFGLDIEQDLLRAVTGVPKEKDIGTRMYGMDALSVSTNIKLDDLPSYLNQIHTKYLDDSYKEDFPWVDHLSEVKSNRKTDELNELLAEKISGADIDRIWLSVPELIPWDEVGGFCYYLKERAPEYHDIHLPDFIDSLKDEDKENIHVDTLKKKYVQCIHVDGHVIYRWQIYKCLYGELELENKTYMLSGGKWYLIPSDFVGMVNESFTSIPDYTITLPEFCDNSEGQYNSRVANELPDSFTLMDAKNIVYGGGFSKIEFCDLYSSDKDIIHVKRYGSSSVLSHLFAQGRISGELFQMESNFRIEVNKLLPNKFRLANAKKRPESGEYKVVFAIVSDIPGDLNVPFFSRLNLKNAVRLLSGLGFSVEKTKIDVCQDNIVTKKYRKRKR
jgi:uncharacterized protein (TIGR04141 family)